MRSMGGCAFCACGFGGGTLTIPDSVKTIGDNAFDGDGGFYEIKTRLYLPAGVYVLSGCEKDLPEAPFPANMT